MRKPHIVKRHGRWCVDIPMDHWAATPWGTGSAMQWLTAARWCDRMNMKGMK